MTKELKEHLIRCENAIQTATLIRDKHDYPDDYRTLTVIGFVSLIIEHQESALCLIRLDKVGSAFALGRPIVEGAYRGLWVNACASDKEIRKFNEKDDIKLTFQKIAEALDPAHNTGNFFQGFKAQWRDLNSYTHGGMRQIERRFTKHEVANNYSDRVISNMTTLTTMCVVVLLSRFLAKQGYAADANAIGDLLETFGPWADAKRYG